MKLDMKKTGLIIAATSAFMATGIMADNHGDKFDSQMDRMVTVTEGTGAHLYGKFGMELLQKTAKKDKDADETSSIALQDGGNRFGVTYTKLFSGAVKSVVGNIEFQAETDADAGGWTLSGRQANIAVNLSNGGTLRLGQQNNHRVSSGGQSASWTGVETELNRGVNGSRYTGVSYVQNFGIASIAVMVGIDGTDDGAKTKATADKQEVVGFVGGNGATVTNTVRGTPETEEGNTLLDKTTLLLGINPTPELSLQLGYDAKAGDAKDDAQTESDIAFGIGYAAGPIVAHLGYAVWKIENRRDDDGNIDREEINRNSLSLNASFNAGALTPFIGYEQAEYDGKDASGNDLADSLTETAVAFAAGVNFGLFGGQSVVQFDSLTNAKGKEGADTTRILTGLFYSF